MCDRVESIEIAAYRGGKYIYISSELMADVWKAMTSSNRYALYFDIDDDSVRALVLSPREKKVGWNKILIGEYENDPGRFILIREADNKKLFEMAEAFRSSAGATVRHLLGSPIRDYESFMDFMQCVKKSGQSLAWMAFLESNRVEMVDAWCTEHNVRIEHNDPLSGLMRIAGLDCSDEESTLNSASAFLQGFTISSEPIVCQSCGRQISPKLRRDLTPSTVGGIPYQQCSAVCECGKENILSYLNDGYHSGYHYVGSAVPWFECVELIEARKGLKGRISSDEEASACLSLMREACRCLDWKEFDACGGRLRRYFKRVPNEGTESFRLYARWVILSSQKRVTAMAAKLDRLVPFAPFLDCLDRAEAYAVKCLRTDRYEGCPEKAIEALRGADASPYERGRILHHMSPMVFCMGEPQGYGEMLVSIFGEIVEDLERMEFRRRWQLSTAIGIMEASCEHAHREDDWSRVLPLLNRLEKVSRDLHRKEKDSKQKEDADYEDEDVESEDEDVKVSVKEAVKIAFDNMKAKWKPDAKFNGVLAATMFKLGSYYLTDGNDSKRGYSYMKGMFEAASETFDFGPITASRLVLSEALMYRSEKKELHLERSVSLLTGICNISEEPFENYASFVYAATADIAGASKIGRMFAEYALPPVFAAPVGEFDPEMLWDFEMYWV